MADKELHLKLATILAGITTVAKTGHNAAQNYDFVTEVDVLNMIRPQLAAANISVQVDITNVTTEYNASTSRSGVGQHITTVIGDIILTDAVTDEKVAFGIAGMGIDSQDKGLPKAITMAVKYGMLKTFLVPTGDDSEATDGEGQTTARTPRVAAPGSPEVAAAREAAELPVYPKAEQVEQGALPWEKPGDAPGPFPAPARQAPPEGGYPPSDRKITEKQQRFLVARKINNKLSDEQFDEILMRFSGQTNKEHVKMDDMDSIVEAINALGAHQA